METTARADVLIVAVNGDTTKTFSDGQPANLPGVGVDSGEPHENGGADGWRGMP